MRIRVLGCSGMPLAGRLTTSYLINERILLDAGSVSAALDLEEQVLIDHILVSHAHLDHIQGIATLADNIIGRREKPVVIHAGPETLDAIRKHILNDRLWPDFTKIPTPEAPALRYNEIEPGVPFDISPFTIEAVPTKHTIPTMGFIIGNEDSSVAYTTDTGPTQLLWRRVGRVSNLEALIIHCAMPNRLREKSIAAGHLTPATMAQELEKLQHEDIKIYVGHLKPVFHSEIAEELYSIKDHEIRILEEGDVIEIGEVENVIDQPVVSTQYEDHDFLIETSSQEKRKAVFHRFGREYQKGEIIFYEGEIGDEMYIIHEG